MMFKNEVKVTDGEDCGYLEALVLTGTQIAVD
jgi:hypothetical protein